LCNKKKRPRCYHWFVEDESSLSAFQEQLEELLDQYLSNCGSSYHKIQRKAKTIYDPCNVTWESNKYNIEFILSGATNEETMHSKKI
jgi:hypothetical protein